MAAWLRQSRDGVVLNLYVQPRASKNELAGIQGEEMKIRLTSPPVDGAANRLCCDFLAKLLGVARREVELEAGEKSRHKRLLVHGLTVEEVRQAVEKEMEKP